MTDRCAAIGMCFDRTFPAVFVREVAQRLEDDGVEELWIIEDCFFTAGVSLAATALAVTDRLRVGLGILPAVARNPAVTAMELATLAELAPGRLMAGIGHGVQPWMAQMGARTPSPLTTLEEVLVTLRRLLADPTATAALGALPCYDELAEVDRAHGVDGLAALPASRWRQIGPVGTIDDALAHAGMLEDAGVDQLALFPAPDVGTARKQLGDVARIARR